jgi:formylglycine-generating enzyme required for sulfatase activity
MPPKNTDNDHSTHAELHGAGALAQGDGAVSASGGGVAVGRDVHGDVTVVTYQGTQVTIPSPEAIAAHRTALQEQLQADACERWGGMAVYIQEEGASLPIEASPYQTGRLGPREKLLHALHTADRLLVLGGPGSGKTVSLERLAWELCGASEPLVPVLVRLFRYDGASLAEWIRAYLQETGFLRLDDERTLAAFLKESEARCFFLFDGLNEVQPDYRDKLVGELERWAKSYPRHPVALTSRPQDELWRRLRDEVDRALVVQPIGDEQAREYLVDHLGARKGQAHYAQLDERLREMARTPLILWLIKEAGEAGESIPGNRGELYARFVSRMLRRDTDRRMDAEIPERLKRRALADLAYHLGQGQRLACPREEAMKVVARRLGDDLALAEKIIGACARHGLLAGRSEVWFAPHQTVQEHFAALALQDITKREWALSGWERLKRGVRRLLTGEGDGLAALAAEDWWMETFVQLAGLVDDTDRLVREISQRNPWLALWCVGEGREVSQETQTLVEERSVYVLHSERLADRRRAVAALAQIRNERVIEPLLWAAGDSDAEVSSLAVQSLGELGKAVVPRAVAALENEDFWTGVVRYGVTYPDERLRARLSLFVEEVLGFPLVWVPPGLFLMGSDKDDDPQAYDDELPQHEVRLPGYWIGRYPVTVAQYRDFVEKSGRDVDERSLKDPDDHPVRYVNWRDALAYCRWLSERTGLPVTLPSEAEWEKAARGTDGRIYPWGNEAPTVDLCNFDNNVGDTTPVGNYSPAGDSPRGCVDMAGNVWEWTRSLYKDYPYDPRDGREDLEAGGRRVVRGVAFDPPEDLVRCAFRGYRHPHYRNNFGGFRVVVSRA